MRKSFIFGVIIGLALAAAPGSRAQTPDLRWAVMASDEKVIVDRLAADFFEESLRRTQAAAIERHTAAIYANASASERARFRAARRAKWRAMSEAERASLRMAHRPLFRNLMEEQKAPFRRYALDRLRGAGALDRSALVDALRNDI